MADVTAERNESEVEASTFSIITEDILMNIFSKLEEDPRHLASLACVCPRFNSIIRSICWKRKCMRVIPAVVADLLQANGRADRLAEPPGGWSALLKLAVCCPGLCHAGIPLENYDLGLERVIGPSHQYKVETRWTVPTRTICSEGTSDSYSAYPWTIYDDMNFHVEYEAELGFALNPREEGFSGIGNGGFAENPNGNIAHIPNRAPENPVGGDTGNGVGENPVGGDTANGVGENPNGQIAKKPHRDAENSIGEMGEGFLANPCAVTECLNGEIADSANLIGNIAGVEGKTSEFSTSHDSPSGAAHNPQEVTCNSRDPIELKRKENPSCDQAGDHKYCDAKKQKKENLAEPHLASDIWNLTREQGNKLLASRFRGDSLYMCDWPGCVHSEGKRIYRVFRGIFKNFRNSYVWRNINDTKAKKSSVNCAFCSSMGTWDMLATFCLRRTVEYYDDGEPSIRAYVCENGHVAGAWTDRPMYK